jgi:RNA polymerase sigma-32 factor
MRDSSTTIAPNNGGARGYLDGYVSAISQYRLLEQSHEQELARRRRDHRDRRASDALVTSHLRLAAKVARGYRGYGFPLADLIGEANLGLVIAASRFEPERGARFSTYALWWIKAAIHDYILRSWSLVKIGTTAAQKKLFFGLRREMSKLAVDAIGLTPEKAELIAQELEVPVRDVIEMDCRLSGDLSLNVQVADDGQTEWEAMLVDQSPDAETIVAEQDESAQRADALRAALHVLTERERRIFEARHLDENPPSLDQLGRELSISSERVRQIESQAFAKVERAAIAHLRQQRQGSSVVGSDARRLATEDA